MFHRLPGSIGASAFPSRVYPGTRSSGRMGGKQTTDEEPRGRQGRRREPPDLPAGRGPRGPEHGRQDREEGLADAGGVRRGTMPTTKKTAPSTSLTVPIRNLNAETVGEANLPEEIFGVPFRRHIVWEVVRAIRAREHAGTHKAKVRSEVSGTGKKPFKQKHTGRARQGGGRPPIHRHGGTVHGPVVALVRPQGQRRDEEGGAALRPLGEAPREPALPPREPRASDPPDEGPRRRDGRSSASRARRSSSTAARTRSSRRRRGTTRSSSSRTPSGSTPTPRSRRRRSS